MNGKLQAGFVVALCSGLALAGDRDVTASKGCKLLDNPTLDGIYNGISLSSVDFHSGDLVMVLATTPGTGIVPTRVRLLVGHAGKEPEKVDEEPLPGELSFRMDSPGEYVIEWRANIGNAAWQVGCKRTGLAMA